MNGFYSVTDFQARVFALVRQIPLGKVTSYQVLAHHLGSSARAVGQALRANPTPVEIPCHRVVRNDGFLGGYFGQTQGAVFAKKVALLQQEGVVFQADERVHPCCFFIDLT
jgi:methylated-DNA-[protein]-cysteine S-methyltransferase